MNEERDTTASEPETQAPMKDRADGQGAVPRWVDALGWVGTSTVLLAHFLANAQRVDDDGFVYHGLNLLGSVLLGYLCVRRSVWQSVWLNTIWGVVAAVAIARIAL